MTQTITAHRRVLSGTDSRGNDVYTRTAEQVDGVSVQPDQSSEDVATGETFTQTWRLFAPATFDLGGLDTVTTDVGDFEIDGEPVIWPGPDGAAHHVEARLKRVTG